MMYEKAIRAIVLLTLTCSFANTGKAQSLMLSTFSVINAKPGSDISKMVSSALSAAEKTCGMVLIVPGSYTWKTAGVRMSPCETLIGTGATVLVDVGSSPLPFLIVEGPAPPYPETDESLAVGGIRGFTFVGPSAPAGQSSSTGIELGGESSARTAQLINLYDVHIRSFGCGINIEWASQIAFFGGSIEANYDGVCFANIITGLENLNFHGTQILNNIDYGINENQTGIWTELNLNSCSLDDNGQFQAFGGQVQITNGKLNIVGGHFEGDRVPMITIAVPGAPATVNMSISGTTFNMTDTNSSSSYAAFFAILGLNDIVELGRGVTFISQGATVSAVADWNPVINQNSRLFMDPYTYQVGNNALGLPGYVGTSPNNYNFPIYDIHDNVTGISSSY